MQKHTGWRLLGVALLLVLTGLTALLGPARPAAAENCCSCHDYMCYSRCYDQCSPSDEACLNSCVDQCWYWDQLCMQNCPYPIC